jgi:hypothetical protein
MHDFTVKKRAVTGLYSNNMNKYLETNQNYKHEEVMSILILYRAIGLVLDFIHRLVCGRQKIPQRFGDWICLRPQVDGAGQPYSVGPVRKS